MSTTADDESYTDEEVEIFREGATMALYVSLSLLAALAVLPKAETRGDRVLAVALTSIGLLLAHWLAFRITSNFNLTELKTVEGLKVLAAQLAGGLVVTAVAVLPILITPTDAGAGFSAGLLLLLVSAVSYNAARASGKSRAASLVYVGIIIAASLAVVALKSASH